MALRLTEKQFRQLERGDAIGRTSKFLNRRTAVDGIPFQSAFEASHYRELKLRLKAGELRNLRWQVEYPLVVNGVEVCRYRADFVYEERDHLQHVLPGLDPTIWRTRIIDTKSEATRRMERYRIKKKLMLALGHEIVEVVSRSRGRQKRPRRR